MTDMLPVEAVEADRRLDKTAAKASEALAKHRWHWTLDESNPARVSVGVYARAVGKAYSVVYKYVHGYEGHLGSEITLSEAMERANMGAEKEAAVEAVAKARGTSFGHARKSTTEVKRVRDMARERAETNGTTVEEEADRAAKWIVQSEQTTKRDQNERANKLGLRFVEMEGLLDAAKRKLTAALTLAHDIEWEDEHRELLTHTVANVKALLGLVDVALVGAADVDWDAELADLFGGTP